MYRELIAGSIRRLLRIPIHSQAIVWLSALGALGAGLQVPTLSCAASVDYLGSSGYVVLGVPSCNSATYAQIPGGSDLFIARQAVLRGGQLPGRDGPKGCDSIGDGAWGLILDQLDWNTHTLTFRKVLLDTSRDPATGHSRAVVTAGPMRGLVIRSAYDASVVVFRGNYLVSYECVLENGKDFGVDGTSSCVSRYDRTTQSVDLGHTQVVVSGVRVNGRFYAAAVPKLLVYKDRLFVYWSSLAIESGKFVGIAVRGAELDLRDNSLYNRKTGNLLSHSIGVDESDEVWAPDPQDPLSNTEVDALALWVHSDSIIAMSSRGGQGCTAPSDTTRGCFRVSMARSRDPLGNHVFNLAQPLLADRLPTNPQEYTQPIMDPQGNYWLIGHYIKPSANGLSDQRPVPDMAFWAQRPAGAAVLVMFPLTDQSVWPSG